MNPLVALPVRLDLSRALATAVQAHVEGVLGWQVVEGPDLPARLVLRSPGRTPDGDGPALLLVDADSDPGQAAHSARSADGIVAWPDERDELPARAEALLAARPSTLAPVRRLVAAAGGVGLTTVALALGGQLAWAGVEALVVARGDVPVPAVPHGEVVGRRPWDAGGRTPGVPGLRVVAATSPIAPAVAGPGLVLDDRGTGLDGDVLVLRRDRAGLAAVEATTAGAIVVADVGPVRLDRVRALAGRRPVVVLPWSARVALAGARRAVPAALPGRWLALLRPLAVSLAGAVHNPSDPGPSTAAGRP